MKKITAVILSLLLMIAAGVSLAQDATPTAGSSAAAPHGKSEVRARLRYQALRIRQGLKSGVLSKDQAAALMDKLKSIGDQARADFNQKWKKTFNQRSESANQSTVGRELQSDLSGETSRTINLDGFKYS